MRGQTYSLIVLLMLISAAVSAQSTWVQHAQQAEEFIRRNQLSRAGGITWPVVPGDTATATNLYSGSAGIVLFYLELYHYTGEQEYLHYARQGADWLVKSLGRPLPGQDEVGLFTGEAGLCFTLRKVYEATDDIRYRDAALTVLDRLTRVTVAAGEGAASLRYTDIVYGAAGVGLALLDWKDVRSARTLAIQLGHGLLQQSEKLPTGRRWYMDTAMVRQQYYMPNFSHGTAGVAYFLARLYELTKDKRFLKGAEEGAAHLATIENKDAWIYHHDREDGQSLYYLSWCHGPAGTIQLYHELYRITKDPVWKDKIRRAADALMKCGIPGTLQPGLWNNQGPCCGTAGVAELFIGLHRLFGDQAYLDFATVITEDLVSKATPEGHSLKWVMAEHRRRPDLLLAQTGYMQGAAGIGMWLLHFDEYLHQRKSFVRLPTDFLPGRK